VHDKARVAKQRVAREGNSLQGAAAERGRSRASGEAAGELVRSAGSSCTRR
jgi:hypothetical protein